MDVFAAVNVVREYDMPFSVKGGSPRDVVAAVVDGGLVIDLGRVRGSAST